MLSPPLTFALSQDQTLHLILITFLHESTSRWSHDGVVQLASVLASSTIQFSETDSNLPPTNPCGPKILCSQSKRVNNFFLLAAPPLSPRRFRPRARRHLPLPSGNGTPLGRFSVFFSRKDSSGMSRVVIWSQRLILVNDQLPNHGQMKPGVQHRRLCCLQGGNQLEPEHGLDRSSGCAKDAGSPGLVST